MSYAIIQDAIGAELDVGTMKQETRQGNRTIRIGSALLLTDGQRVLLGKRNKHPDFGRWVLPGGKIEYGETHQEAAAREALEELGLHVRIDRLAGAGVYHLVTPERHRAIVYNVAHVTGGELSCSSDISEARFFLPGELLALDIPEIVGRVLADEGWLSEHSENDESPASLSRNL